MAGACAKSSAPFHCARVITPLDPMALPIPDVTFLEEE
jgi:hypothetical protein